MQAWALTSYGDNSKVRLMEFPEPVPDADEVLIEIQAASINPVDFKIRNGDLKLVLPYKLPFILGNDGSGIVSKVGAQVRKFKPGDEVFMRPHKERVGTFAPQIAVKESAVAFKPKSVSFAEAAGLPLIGLTSWQAFQRINLQAGQRIFIPAGSGGVGSFAIQLAKYRDAYVISNTSTKNLDFVKSLGADVVIDYKTQDFSKLISNLDAVFDTMGGETQKKCFPLLKKGGSLISIVGPPTAAFLKEAGFSYPLQMIAGLLGLPAKLRARANGCSYQFLFMSPDGETLQKIADLVDGKKIRPVVDRVFPFQETPQALAYVEEGRARGKVIIAMEKS